MDRLTTDKPIEKMNMTELALNCCYVKDGKARYRDYDTDIDARAFVRSLLLDYYIVNGENEVLTDNLAFDFAMVDWLINRSKQAKGLIALFYRNLWVMAELRERLKYYEDAEEQGLLIKLPCKVGDTVYEPRPSRGYVQEYIITSIEIYDDSLIYRWDLKDGKGSFSFVAGISGNAIGKTVFLTREAAEAALKEVKK